MPLMTPPLARALRAFRRDEAGSMAIEGILVLPLLAWVYVASFVLFDGFHAQSIKVKAGYTIGDVLSRETGYVTPAYMNSLYALQDVLLDTDAPRRLRVSAIEYEATGDQYLVRWSQVRGGGAALTNAALIGLRPKLPIMVDEEVVVLTETWADYVPVFDAGIDPFTFTDLVVTRPRFASQLCWNSSNTGGASTATC